MFKPHVRTFSSTTCSGETVNSQVLSTSPVYPSEVCGFLVKGQNIPIQLYPRSVRVRCRRVRELPQSGLVRIQNLNRRKRSLSLELLEWLIMLYSHSQKLDTFISVIHDLKNIRKNHYETFILHNNNAKKLLKNK